jgi:hypothetical protein
MHMKILKMALTTALVILAFQAQAKESYTMQSVGWVAPYTALPGTSSSDKDADWGCTFLEKGESCKLCSLGTNKDRAITTLHAVVAAWERDYSYQYDLSGVRATRLTTAREGTSKSGLLHAEACGILTLVKPAPQVAGND